jgi:hypothetical protein
MSSWSKLQTDYHSSIMFQVVAIRHGTRRLRVCNGGLKVFTVREGEQVSLELPAPHGHRSATDASGGRTFITDDELLQHHVTSLILSVGSRRR